MNDLIKQLDKTLALIDKLLEKYSKETKLCEALLNTKASLIGHRLDLCLEEGK